MKKYWTVMSVSFQTISEYRLNLFMDFLSSGVNGLVLFLFWSSVASGMSGLGGYNNMSLGIYFILVTVVSTIINNDKETVANEIKDGEIGGKLLKPINYLLMKFSSNISYKIISFATGAIISIAVLRFVNLTPSLQNLVISALAIILSLIGNYLVYFLLGLMAFWTKQTHGFASMVSIITALVSGRLIPLEILPKNINILSTLLPFRYFIYFPVQILLEKLPNEEIIIGMMNQFIWIVILLFIVKFVWNRGVKKLEVIGI